MLAAINNESFWILVCFILLMCFTYRYLRKSMANFIDQKIAKVSSDLDNVVKAYDKAVVALQTAEDDLKKARDKSQNMINTITMECDNMKSSQLALFKAQLERKEEELATSIKQIYDLAEIEVRHKIIDSAQLLVIEYLNQHVQSDPNQASTISNMLKNLKIN